MAKTPVLDGNDVSKWQGKIDWAKAKADGCQFAILRAGYGDALSYPGQKDPSFEYNYSECKRVGIAVGAYWYSYATTTQQAVQEAKSFLEVVKGKSFEMPLLNDVEEARIFNTGKTNEIHKAWADVMEGAGYFIGIYIYRAAAQAYLSSTTRTRYCMAIADYTTKDIFSVYKDPVGIWQNSSTAHRNGISGNVDHDYCYEDYPSIIKSRGKNGFKATKTSTTTTTTKPKQTSEPVIPVMPTKTYKEIADEVIAGKWSTGAKRRELLTAAGYKADEVQAIVDQKMSSQKPKKSITEIAKEVIRGEWGVYPDRKWKLKAAGYDYDEVQKKVDELLK